MIEYGYCSITVANQDGTWVIRFVSKNYTHLWKSFANRFHLILHADICLFVQLRCDVYPNMALAFNEGAPSGARRRQHASVRSDGTGRGVASPESSPPSRLPCHGVYPTGPPEIREGNVRFRPEFPSLLSHSLRFSLLRKLKSQIFANIPTLLPVSYVMYSQASGSTVWLVH